MEPTALPPAATRTDPAPRLGTRLPDTKLVLVTVALDLAWLWADSFDWRKVAAGAVALFAGWLAPSWRPPTAGADQVIAGLRPGDPVGPATADGRRFVVVQTGGTFPPPRP